MKENSAEKKREAKYLLEMTHENWKTDIADCHGKYESLLQYKDFVVEDNLEKDQIIGALKVEVIELKQNYNADMKEINRLHRVAIAKWRSKLEIMTERKVTLEKKLLKESETVYYWYQKHQLLHEQLKVEKKEAVKAAKKVKKEWVGVVGLVKEKKRREKRIRLTAEQREEKEREIRRE